jgi:hypothetical protein
MTAHEPSVGQTFAQALVAMSFVGAMFLISMGLSGLLAIGASELVGKPFVAGDLPGVTYTVERCSDYFEYHPEAVNCAEAAADHHYDELVGNRLTEGVLGLVLLVSWWLARSTFRGRLGREVVPPSFEPTACAALFTASAILLGGPGTIQLLVVGTAGGAGALLSTALVSAMAAVAFWAVLIRRLREQGRLLV